jgi:hypothetical protein
MKLGTENKKATYWLVGLFVVLGYEFYSNVLAGPSGSVSSTAAPVAAPAAGDAEDSAQAARAAIRAHSRDEFLPKLRDKHAAKQLDPNTVDPTIHTELLAKLDEVPAAGSGRDLFSFGKAAPVLKAEMEPVVRVKPWTPIGPPVVHPPAPHVDPPPPPPPPINLKYYGIVTTLANGKKTAFFMDGDQILLETEGVTFNKGKYKLVRVGATSAVVEDIEHKHEQTLPLAEDAQA